MRKDAQQLSVDVPSPDRDSPAWVKVGVIAAVGFVIGIAWPRIVGVRLGPSAPGEASASASAAPAPRASDAPPASVAAKPIVSVAAAPPAASSAAPAGPPQVSVPKGAIIGCKTDEGENKKGKDCGSAASI